MVNDLLEGVETFLQESEKQKILFDGKVVANNERLDIYRKKIAQHDLFKNMMKKYVFGLADENGEVFTKMALSKKFGKNAPIISKSAFEKISNCSSWFKFESSENWRNHRVKKSNRCGNKYCPHCSRVSALKRTLEAQNMMEALNEDGTEFIFITLTFKNVFEKDLSQAITKMNKAVTDNFLKSKELKRFNLGTIRKLELTYNPYLYQKKKVVFDRKGNKVIDETKAPFNPHIHLLVAYDPKKYSGRNYVSQKRFAEIWQRSMKLDYLPVLDVRKVKRRNLTEEEKEAFEREHAHAMDDKEKQRLVDGAFEIGKYIAKPNEYLESEMLFEMFFRNLFKRRAWTFTGVFKKMHAENKGKRFESILEKEDIEYMYEVDYNLKKKDYYMTKVRLIDKE